MDNWGRWGEEDERGALNLVTAETVRAATAAIRSGKVYSLGLPIQRAGVPNVDYRAVPQRLTMSDHTDEQRLVAYGGKPGIGASEDVVVMPTHTVTHMDALAHVYKDGELYNGFPQADHTSYDGAARCGIEKVGPVATRGVLLDVPAALGVDHLEPGKVVTAAELEACLERQGTVLRPGDAVLVRTGWLEAFYASGEEMSLEQPGIGLEAAQLLAAADVAIVGADNTAVEAMPFDRDDFMPVHVELLVRRGVNLVEHVVLAELAKDLCCEFLFCVAPLPITGASASPVCPFAIA